MLSTLENLNIIAIDVFMVDNGVNISVTIGAAHAEHTTESLPRLSKRSTTPYNGRFNSNCKSHMFYL